MSQIIDYDDDATLASSDVFLMDGEEGTRAVSFSNLLLNLEQAFGFEILEGSTVDLNNVVDGTHYYRPTVLNVPAAGLGGILIQKSRENYTMQFAITWNGNLFYRQSSNSKETWTAWTYPYADMKSFELNGTTLTITDTM